MIEQPDISNNEDLRWAIWGIIAVFIFIPYGIYTNVRPFALLVVAYSTIMTMLRKPGAPLVVIAMALCMPMFVGLRELGLEPVLAGKVRWIFASIRLSVIINVGYIVLFRQSKRLFAGIWIISILCIFIFSLYGSVSSSLIKVMNLLLYVHLFFLWCYNEDLSLESLYTITSAIFIFMALYAILQFHYDITPYRVWYLSTTRNDEISHAAGLCGNALIFSAIILAYHALLLIKLLAYGKIKIWLLLLVFYTAIIALERTTIIVIIIEWIVFLAFGFGKIKKNIIPFIILLALIVLVLNTQILDSVLNAFGERFEQGSEHRFAAYPTVFAALSDNIYGYGDYDIYHIGQLYGTFGLIKGFGTLDNFYLTELLKYGVFAIIPILFYLFYFIKAFITKGTNHDLFRYVVIMFLPWVLTGFSFNINSYAQLSVLYYGLVGYIYSLYYKEPISNSVLN